MANQPILHGTNAGDGSGESLFNAFTKVNANFAELYATDGVHDTGIASASMAAQAAQATADSKEGGLGNPATNGEVLTSQTDGTRAWAPPAGGTGAVDSVNGQTGVVVIAKADVGLASVDNTADTAKPVSAAQQAAIDAAAASGHTLQDEGIAVTDRAGMDFVGGGVTVTDDLANDKTVVTIPGFSVSLEQAGNEYTPAGVLVYPSHVAQTLDYNADGTLNYSQTASVFNTFTWTLTMATYDANGNITLMTADNGTGGSSWTKALTYNADGMLASEGAWV